MDGMFDLSGRAALVTGGSRGLGKEMALALAGAGADVVVGSRSSVDVAAAAAEIAQATGRKVLPVTLDVTERALVESAVATTVKEFGRIDILVNNAGINIRSPVGRITDEDWQQIQRTNVTGVMYGCRAAAPHMVKAGFGRIINVGSGLSLVGLAERVSYCASKAAVLGLTRALAVELAQTGVTVNCICPGPFLTEINRPLAEDPAAAEALLAKVPMARWGELREIRAAAVFLASPAASYVTGAAIPVDGGWTAW